MSEVPTMYVDHKHLLVGSDRNWTKVIDDFELSTALLVGSYKNPTTPVPTMTDNRQPLLDPSHKPDKRPSFNSCRRSVFVGKQTSAGIFLRQEPLRAIARELFAHVPDVFDVAADGYCWREGAPLFSLPRLGHSNDLGFSPKVGGRMCCWRSASSKSLSWRCISREQKVMKM